MVTVKLSLKGKRIFLVETLCFQLLLVLYGQIITHSPLPTLENRNLLWKYKQTIITAVRGATIIY